MKILSTRNKFQIGSGLIIVITGIAVSLLVYKNLQDQAIKTVQQKTQVYLNTANAIRIYIKDSLRPKIQKELPTDRFILEAMSTSYISRQIMRLLKEQTPEFQYKRAARNPRNPINQADDFETEKIKWFDQNRDIKRWAGVITKNKKPYYAELMPIAVEKECLTCHGNPLEAPREVKNLYGSVASFGYNIGEVVAADTIYIPMAHSNMLIKERAWLVFIIGVFLLFLLIVTITVLFNHTVVTQLRGTVKRFQQLFSASGKPFPIDFNRVGDEFEQVQGAFEQTADHLIVVHNELRNSERKYRKIFESSPDAIFICDATYMILELNSAGLKIFEFDEKDQSLHLFSLLDLFTGQNDKVHVINQMQSGKTQINIDIQMCTVTGRKIDVIFSANSVIDEDKKFIGIEGFIRDVTKRKQMDKYLAQTEKLASIGQLAAGIAHEINNPLGVIKCYSDLIQKNPKGDDQISEDIGVIQKHTQNCKTIVESLLNFARVSEPSFKKTELHACLDDVLSVLLSEMTKQNISINKKYNQDITSIDLDDSKFKQVLLNILLNGIQAMVGGGSFTIETGYTDVENQIYINIIDTGSGIPLKIQNKIFEPFFTTKTPGTGTGLGLSVSYGIIQQHKGDILVFNNDDKGATFSIKLPIEASNQTKTITT